MTSSPAPTLVSKTLLREVAGRELALKHLLVGKVFHIAKGARLTNFESRNFLSSFPHRCQLRPLCPPSPHSVVSIATPEPHPSNTRTNKSLPTIRPFHLLKAVHNQSCHTLVMAMVDLRVRVSFPTYSAATCST